MLARRTMLGASAAALLMPRFLRAATTGWFRQAIVIDGLSGLEDPYAPPGQTRLSDRFKSELRQTGTTAIRTTLLPVGNDPLAWEHVNESADQLDALFAANPDFLLKIEKAADIEAAKKSGRFGIICGTQDTSMIGADLDRLAKLKARGLRCVQLTYNLRNLSGDGSLERDNAGLSALARATIERVEAEHLLLDLSHGGARTIREALAQAKRPPTISHTGCRDLFDHPRNIYDADMRTVAEKGGVGMYFMPFLVANSKPTAADLIAHIEHAWKICGEDHVGIGTDGPQIPLVINDATWEDQRKFYEARAKQGIAAPGEGADILNVVMEYNRLDRFEKLASDLAARGHSPAKIGKLLGGNNLRLYRDAWGG